MRRCADRRHLQLSLSSRVLGRFHVLIPILREDGSLDVVSAVTYSLEFPMVQSVSREDSDRAVRT